MATTIIWFRRDLRVQDNPALLAAAAAERLLPVYVHAPHDDGAWPNGEASDWWLHHALAALDEQLRAVGSRLVVEHGASAEVLPRIAVECGADAVYVNRLYEPAARERDATVRNALAAQGIHWHEFNSALWYEPWERLKADGTPYRVFTPFWKSYLKAGLQQMPVPAPRRLPPPPDGVRGLALDALELLPRRTWYVGLQAQWQPGEPDAAEQLTRFLDYALADYPDERDIPGHAGTSRLSPHLHFGEIGARQIGYQIQRRLADVPAATPAAESYLRELGWREFAYHLLYHFPHTTDQPLDARFAAFPWRDDYHADLRRWQRGETGIPIVDAGMRELWETGWMHNRVRMIVASLLTKNLLIPWQEGARWFWDTLVDADLANNTLGWQWTAGCGADAAPYFRVFNPVTQGQRFDPKAQYVRRWVPELAALPDKYIHRPWEAPNGVLDQGGVTLDRDYPQPICDLRASRAEALARFETIKSAPRA